MISYIRYSSMIHCVTAFLFCIALHRGELYCIVFRHFHMNVAGGDGLGRAKNQMGAPADGASSILKSLI